MVCQNIYINIIFHPVCLIVLFYFVNLNELGCSSTCFEGRWACKRLQTPATCAVEEGSHVTTFDGKTYTFHGDCYYTLAKVESKVNE